MRVSAVVTAYNNASTIQRVLQSLLSCPFDEIVVAVGGEDGTTEIARRFVDPRMLILHEGRRIGKMQALKRALVHVSGNLIYLVSGDIAFDSAEVWKLLGCFSPKTGSVVPKVLPSRDPGLASRISYSLWNVRNNHLKELDREGMPLHGGELMVIRREVLDELPDVVNDDAYMCLRAAEMGYETRYTETATITNMSPPTIGKLLSQRVRVNYGHLELLNLNMSPSVMSGILLRRPAIFFRVVLNSISSRRSDLFFIPVMATIECISIVLSKKALRKNRSFAIWPLAH